MIFCATKKTFERYHKPLPEKKQTSVSKPVNTVARGDRVYAWGCKIFYFDRRKSLQLVHYDTRLTLFLVDIKIADSTSVSLAVFDSLRRLYAYDPIMLRAVDRYVSAHPDSSYRPITDRRVIATLNRNQREFARDGYAFYDYFENGRVNTERANADINAVPFNRKWGKKTEQCRPYDLFRKKLITKFKEDK